MVKSPKINELNIVWTMKDTSLIYIHQWHRKNNIDFIDDSYHACIQQNQAIKLVIDLGREAFIAKTDIE